MGNEHDHGGHGHDGGPHGGGCPCCGKEHHHATYFREYVVAYEQDGTYQRIREYAARCPPKGKGERPRETPEQQPDPACNARTTSGLWIRKSTQAMTATEWDDFRNAWLQLCASGFIGRMVAIHADGSHQMHGRTGNGLRRFLPWHRVFLLRLEAELHRADPCAILPYWDWDPDQRFPAGIATFTPQVPMPSGPALTPTRNAWTTGAAAPPSFFPPAGTEAAVIAAPEYALHATDNQAAHDSVHGAVGGTMGVIRTAPCDPIFWMHHAQCDRLWHLWQQANPGAGTGLAGAAAVMDPWSETDADVASIATLGYTYL